MKVPRAYYNEIDPYCVEWLHNLIHAGLIAPGEVDNRSIEDVTPNDLAGFAQCHFFAGLGGWSAALRLAAWPDHREVWTGSCPCQPFSLAGKQGGFADKRHLWPSWFYLIEKCRPAVVLGEQVASATAWLGLVRSDLEALDYAVGTMPIQAASAGADHLRDRYWFVANPDDAGPQRRRVLPERAGERVAGADGVADASGRRLSRPGQGQGEQPRRTETQRPSDPSGDVGDDCCSTGERHAGSILTAQAGERSAGRVDGDLPNGSPDAGSPVLEWVVGADGKARRVKSGICLLAHGVPNRVAKLRAFGNAVDIRPAAAFIKAIQ